MKNDMVWINSFMIASNKKTENDIKKTNNIETINNDYNSQISIENVDEEY